MAEEKAIAAPKVLDLRMDLKKTKDMAKQLDEFITENKLFTTISNKKYAHVEAWQFAGSQLGLVAIITECEPVASESHAIIKYRATVEVMHMATGQVVSRGFAWCDSTEQKKRTFDEYAIASMAQTRAIGKAYRNIISWILKAGGYEGTPSDEMNPEKTEEDLRKAKFEVAARINDSTLPAEKRSKYVAAVQKAIKGNTVTTFEQAKAAMDAMDEVDIQSENLTGDEFAEAAEVPVNQNFKGALELELSQLPTTERLRLIKNATAQKKMKLDQLSVNEWRELRRLVDELNEGSDQTPE